MDLDRWLWVETQNQSKRIAALEKEIVELRVLLAEALKNASTSSKSPSSDIVKPSKSLPPCGACNSGGHPKHGCRVIAPDEIAAEGYTLGACPDRQGSLRRLPGVLVPIAFDYLVQAVQADFNREPSPTLLLNPP